MSAHTFCMFLASREPPRVAMFDMSISYRSTTPNSFILQFFSKHVHTWSVKAQRVSVLGFVKAWRVWQGKHSCSHILLQKPAFLYQDLPSCTPPNTQLQEELTHSGRRKEGRKGPRPWTARSAKSTPANNEAADVTRSTQPHI